MPPVGGPIQMFVPSGVASTANPTSAAIPTIATRFKQADFFIFCASFHRRTPLPRHASFTSLQSYLAITYHISAVFRKPKLRFT